MHLISVPAAPVPASSIVSPDVRAKLREFTSKQVAQVDMSQGDELSSSPFSVTLDPSEAVPLAATNAKDATVEAAQWVKSDPFGQAAAVVDAGKGAMWMMRANVTPISYNSSDAPGATTPFYFTPETSRNSFVQNVPGLLAFVGDTKTIELDPKGDQSPGLL